MKRNYHCYDFYLNMWLHYQQALTDRKNVTVKERLFLLEQEAFYRQRAIETQGTLKIGEALTLTQDPIFPIYPPN